LRIVTDPYADFRPERTSGEALHEQVSGYLHALMLNGTLPPRTQLPAEPVLSERLGVSRGTLRRATATLIERGLLTQRHGLGTFVADLGLGVEAPFVSEITSLAQSLSLRGVATTTRVLVLDRRPADARVAEQLRVRPGDEVIHLDRVRADPSGPVMRLINVMRPDVIELDDPAQLEDRALYDHFEAGGWVPAEADRTIGAAVADGELARLLDVPVGHPLLHIEQLTTLADGRPLEFSDVWIRGERLRLQVHVRR
jgi:DNA-binding GntR family transcriptional regulator